MVMHQPTKHCLDMMGGKIGAHYTDDDTAPTLTHGKRLFSETSQGECRVDDSSLSRKENEAERALRNLWRGKQAIGHSSQGRELEEQFVREFAMSMQELPSQGSSRKQEEMIRNMKYIVRRLTPTETERLMGLPDGWTIPKNLVITDELVEEFRTIHDNFKRIMAEYEIKPIPKQTSANQVRKWLEKITNPETCPDAPRYKGCGNGWATNQPRWILTRLLVQEGIDPFEN